MDEIKSSEVKKFRKSLQNCLMDTMIIHFEKLFVKQQHNFTCQEPSTLLRFHPFLLAKILKRSYETGWMIEYGQLDICLQKNAMFWVDVDLRHNPFYPLETICFKMTRKLDKAPTTGFIYNQPVTLESFKDICEGVSSFEVLSCRLQDGHSKVIELGQELKNIKRLSLDLSLVSHLPLELDFKLCKETLEFLALEYGELNEKLAEEIGSLENLRHLSLFGSSLRNVRLFANAIGRLAKLRSLDLGKCRTTGNLLTPDLMHSIGKLNHLRVLNLSGYGESSEKTLKPLREKQFRFLGIDPNIGNSLEYDHVKNMAIDVAGYFNMKTLLTALKFNSRRPDIFKTLLIELVLLLDETRLTNSDLKDLERIVLDGLASFKSNEFVISRMKIVVDAILSYGKSEEFVIKLASLIASITLASNKEEIKHFGYQASAHNSLTSIVTRDLTMPIVFDYIRGGPNRHLAIKFMEFILRFLSNWWFNPTKESLIELCSDVISKNLLNDDIRMRVSFILNSTENLK